MEPGHIVRGEGPNDEFEVLGWLGEGRTAEVYKVRNAKPEDARSGHRIRLRATVEDGEDFVPDTYALKIAKADEDLELPQRNEQINREQYVLERLGRAAPVLSFAANGYHEGRAFLVLQLLNGPTLGEHLRSKGRVRYHELMQLFLKVAEGVAECHRWNFIHRDLRPSHLIIDEGAGGPVLFDFESCELGVRRASSKLAAGTAEYAPPEYLAHVLDPEVIYIHHPRADVYPLGVLLYSLFTGRLPVLRTAQSLREYLEELRDKTPPPIGQLNPDAPPACAALAMRLLGKAADRPADAQQVVTLFREAMEADKAAFLRLAPEYQAESETLLSSFESAPTVKPKAPRNWAVVEKIGRRVALVAAFLLLAGSTALALRIAVVYGEVANKQREVADAQLRVTRQLLANTEPLPEQLSGAIPSARAEVREILRGLKMPEKPERTWLRPDSDGRCRNHLTGEVIKGVVVLRDTCWDVASKEDKTMPCPDEWYDAPPETTKAHLRNACFRPIIKMSKPEATTPTKP